jgi:hypothetical protein
MRFETAFKLILYSHNYPTSFEVGFGYCVFAGKSVGGALELWVYNLLLNGGGYPHLRVSI